MNLERESSTSSALEETVEREVKVNQNNFQSYIS